MVDFCKANNIHTTAYTSLGRAHNDLFKEPSVAKVAEVVACRAKVAEREAAETAADCLDDATRACTDGCSVE